MTPDCKFSMFDRVDKKNGYRFPGTVQSIFRNTKGEVRVVVEMEGYGLLHIFNEDQLERRNA